MCNYYVLILLYELKTKKNKYIYIYINFVQICVIAFIISFHNLYNNWSYDTSYIMLVFIGTYP